MNTEVVDEFYYSAKRPKTAKLERVAKRMVVHEVDFGEVKTRPMGYRFRFISEDGNVHRVLKTEMRFETISFNIISFTGTFLNETDRIQVDAIEEHGQAITINTDIGVSVLHERNSDTVYLIMAYTKVQKEKW